MSAARMLLALAVLPFIVRPAAAELAPRYTTWQDYGAIPRQAGIPHVLGVVDAIERVGAGRYVVRGKTCMVALRVLRKGATAENGQPIPGPSRVVRVEVGAKHCGS